MKFLINNLKMYRRFASRHFEIIYLKFHTFWFEINSFNSFSSSRAQSISKKSLLIFSCFLDERKETNRSSSRFSMRPDFFYRSVVIAFLKARDSRKWSKGTLENGKRTQKMFSMSPCHFPMSSCPIFCHLLLSRRL